MTHSVHFAFVDVFADEPLTGNPLALVPDADGLAESTMRSIAREFNQSETTFIVRPTRDAALWRLRSFTAAGVEVLGAGHNAMGAWIWLADSGRLPDGEEFAQQIGDEVLGVRVTRSAAGRSIVSMDHSAPVFGAVLDDLSALASALGLAPADLLDDIPTQVVSTGAAHLLVPLRSRETVDRVSPDPGKLLSVLGVAGGEGCYVCSRDPWDAGSTAYARFFNPTVGIAEDPATGTAAGPLAVVLARRGLATAGGDVIIEQGYALGRPSRLRVTAEGDRVRLSGSGLIVASGSLAI